MEFYIFLFVNNLAVSFWPLAFGSKTLAKVNKKRIRIDKNTILSVLEFCVSLQISENSDIRYARI